MKKKSVLIHALVSAAALIAVVAGGCNPVGQFRDLVDGGSLALSKEDAAYRQLKATSEQRGEASLQALSHWVSTLSSLKTVMASANERLAGKKEQKIRANKDVQASLSRFKQGLDEVLSRNYAEAAPRLVPPWKMQEARELAIQAPNALKAISSYYEAVFAAANPHAGKAYAIDVREDTAILDTYEPCVAKVAALSRYQAKNSFCVNAARAACGHQIDLGCVTSKVGAALVNNLCPEVKTVSLKIPVDSSFRPEAHIDYRTEELKEWRYGGTFDEPNPDRTVATFCPGEYSPAAKAVLSSSYCGYGPKVRIYGYNQDRHVLVEIEGVRRDDPRKDVIVDIYAEGGFVGTRVIRSDYGWRDNVYSFYVTERAFQTGSILKLQFRDIMDVTVTDANTGQSRARKAHWLVEAQLRGEDVPFLRKREVLLTKYTPNAWVGGIVSSCVSATPVLK